MSKDARPSIGTRGLVHEINPATNRPGIKVRLAITETDGTTSEWSIWVPGEDDLHRAEDLARKEIHRISALLVEPEESAAEATEAPPVDPSTGKKTRERIVQKGAKLGDRFRRLQGGTDE